MKLFLFSVLMCSVFIGKTQTKLITQAIITTTTNIIAPEDEDVSQIQNQGGGGFNFRNFSDGETKSTTYIKNELVKTNYKSESFRGSMYRNNATKITTTIFEIMGNKQGFYSSDNDQAEMLKKMDSLMKERVKTDTSIKPRSRSVNFLSNIVNTNEIKKIAGYNCKKAIVITDKIIAKDTLAVWYTPDVKFTNVTSTGGTSGFGNIGGGGSNNSFDKIDGFVMMYEKSMPRGRRMEVRVTKIDIDNEIADKEFEIPKDVEIKSMKEMGGQGGGFRIQRP